MMPEQTPRLSLPLGQSDFLVLRTCGAGYVDKTALIEKLCRDRAEVFLARPRRFEKSLLVSTIGSLFAHGLRDFQGLAISRRWFLSPNRSVLCTDLFNAPIVFFPMTERHNIYASIQNMLGHGARVLASCLP